MSELLRVINSALLAFAICIFIAFVVNSMKKRINVFGDPPINKVVFLLGKIANFGCWTLFAYKTVEGYVSPAAHQVWLLALSTLFLLAAGVFMLFSFVTLGDLNRFGLPDRKTRIVDTGIYSVSRNPMYVGFYLLNVSSVLFFPHPVNAVMAVAGIAIHHLIVLGEERHMAKTFGPEWDEYRKRVRRYL